MFLSRIALVQVSNQGDVRAAMMPSTRLFCTIFPWSVFNDSWRDQVQWRIYDFSNSSNSHIDSRYLSEMDKLLLDKRLKKNKSAHYFRYCCMCAVPPNLSNSKRYESRTTPYTLSASSNQLMKCSTISLLESMSDRAIWKYLVCSL